MKLDALVALPTGVVTEMLPEVAPAGTVALSCVPETTVKLAALPLNLTELAPQRPRPKMLTEVPTGPLVGEKLEIEGGKLQRA